MGWSMAVETSIRETRSANAQSAKQRPARAKRAREKDDNLQPGKVTLYRMPRSAYSSAVGRVKPICGFGGAVCGATHVAHHAANARHIDQSPTESRDIEFLG